MRRAPSVLARVVLGACLSALLAGPLEAKDPKPAGKPPAGRPSAATRAEAVAKALRRLDEDVLASEEDMNEQHKVFTRSIAGLDFLMDASGGKGAAHADRVDRCFESVRRYVEGAAAHEKARKPGRVEGDMAAMEWSQTTWSLSAAAVFCAELVARGTKKAAAAATLKTAADLLAKSQQADGGFGHDRDGRPRLPEIEVGGRKVKYPNTLVSASNWAAFALGTARPLVGKGLDAVVAKAKSYYAASFEAEGCYPYDPSQKGSAGGSDPTAPARTAGSWCALRALGVPAKDPSLSRTADYLRRRVDAMPEGHGSAPHGVFFGAIACAGIGADARKAFEDGIVRRILAAQDDDPKEGGAFDCICRKDFATTCESFKAPDPVESMAGFKGPPSWKAWRRAYVNALNLFAVQCSAARPKFLEGVPADAGPPPGGDVTPTDPPAPPPAMDGG